MLHMAVKNPFLVIENFLSLALCEDTIHDMNCVIPSYSPGEKQELILQYVQVDEYLEEIMLAKLQPYLKKLEQYYSVEVDKVENITFEWMTEGCVASSPHSENADFIQRQWVKTRNYDFTGVLFLVDHAQLPEEFDANFEVLGGKLEFPQHHFGFHAQRGSLVIFPSDPHFINLNSDIQAGELFQVRFQISTKEPFLYNPKQFEGNYAKWFMN